MWRAEPCSLHTRSMTTWNTSCANHVNTASLFSKDDLLNTKFKEKMDKEILVTMYNSANPYHLGLIRRFLPIIQPNRTMSRIFQKGPMRAFSKQKTKDALMSAKLTYPLVEEDKEVFKIKNTACHTIMCKYCKYLNKSDQIICVSPWSQGSDAEPLATLTMWYISLNTCLKCSTQYVGDAKRLVRQGSMNIIDLLTVW